LQVSKKLLVAEGDEIVLVLICHVLSRHSFVVDASRDFAEAERMLAQNDYDAVLLDVRMPDSGAEALRRILSRNPKLSGRVIAMTTSVDDAQKLEGIKLGAVVKKPVEIYELIEIVRRCAEGR
jgi:DNA-binding response OmpR family regulator